MFESNGNGFDSYEDSTIESLRVEMSGDIVPTWDEIVAGADAILAGEGSEEELEGKDIDIGNNVTAGDPIEGSGVTEDAIAEDVAADAKDNSINNSDESEKGGITEIDNGNGTVTFECEFQIDPSQYRSASYMPLPEGVNPKDYTLPGQKQKIITMKQSLDEALQKTLSSVSTPCAIVMDARSPSINCKTTFTDCQAKNPLFCPYHGKKLLEEDLVRQIKAAGIPGHVTIEASSNRQFVDKGKFFTLKVRVKANDAKKTREILDKFLHQPGIKKAYMDDYSTKYEQFTAIYDVDLLEANRPPAVKPTKERDPEEVQTAETGEEITESSENGNVAQEPSDTPKAEGEETVIESEGGKGNAPGRKGTTPQSRIMDKMKWDIQNTAAMLREQLGYFDEDEKRIININTISDEFDNIQNREERSPKGDAFNKAAQDYRKVLAQTSGSLGHLSRLADAYAEVQKTGGSESVVKTRKVLRGIYAHLMKKKGIKSLENMRTKLMEAKKRCDEEWKKRITEDREKTQKGLDEKYAVAANQCSEALASAEGSPASTTELYNDAVKDMKTLRAELPVDAEDIIDRSGMSAALTNLYSALKTIAPLQRDYLGLKSSFAEVTPEELEYKYEKFEKGAKELARAIKEISAAKKAMSKQAKSVKDTYAALKSAKDE